MMNNLGMLLVLIAFMGNVFNLLEDDSTEYLLLMAFGSFILALYSFGENQWAFLVLNVVWYMSAMAGLAMKKGRA